MIGRGLFSTYEMERADVDAILVEAASFREVLSRPIPVVPALRGSTIAMLFFENSTRTRTSFELAAKRLSADVLNFSPATSSVSKGESMRDTAETIAAMGAAAMVVRHSSAGLPLAMSEWSGLPVVNAGDGSHEHPSQALVDLVTLTDRRGNVDGARVTIVGDIDHSRVARSNIWLLSAMGAHVTLVAPPTLLPATTVGWPVDVTDDLEDVLPETDVLMLLRIQRERGAGRRLPSLREFTMRYGMDARRAEMLPEGALIMHPGPINRGIEISPAVADSPNAVIGEQVANGVAVRMAILYRVLAGAAGKAVGAVDA